MRDSLFKTLQIALILSLACMAETQSFAASACPNAKPNMPALAFTMTYPSCSPELFADAKAKGYTAMSFMPTFGIDPKTGKTLYKFNGQQLTDYQGIDKCLDLAWQAGMDIVYQPHLESTLSLKQTHKGGAEAQWRGHVDFRPDADYEKMLFGPFEKWLKRHSKQVQKSSQQISVTVSAELELSVTKYPGDWNRVVSNQKKNLEKLGLKDKVKVGYNPNWSPSARPLSQEDRNTPHVPQRKKPEEIQQEKLMRSCLKKEGHPAPEPQKSDPDVWKKIFYPGFKFDCENYRALLRNSDYLAVSYYGTVTPATKDGPKAQQFMKERQRSLAYGFVNPTDSSLNPLCPFTDPETKQEDWQARERLERRVQSKLGVGETGVQSTFDGHSPHRFYELPLSEIAYRNTKAKMTVVGAPKDNPEIQAFEGAQRQIEANNILSSFEKIAGPCARYVRPKEVLSGKSTLINSLSPKKQEQFKKLTKQLYEPQEQKYLQEARNYYKNLLNLGRSGYGRTPNFLTLWSYGFEDQDGVNLQYRTDDKGNLMLHHPDQEITKAMREYTKERCGSVPRVASAKPKPKPSPSPSKDCADCAAKARQEQSAPWDKFLPMLPTMRELNKFEFLTPQSAPAPDDTKH